MYTIYLYIDWVVRTSTNTVYDKVQCTLSMSILSAFVLHAPGQRRGSRKGPRAQQRTCPTWRATPGILQSSTPCRQPSEQE